MGLIKAGLKVFAEVSMAGIARKPRGGLQKGAVGGDDPERDDNKTGSDQPDIENENRSLPTGEGGKSENNEKSDDGKSAETDR